MTINPLPTNWSIQKLSTCCEIVSGATPKRNVEKYWDGDIPWVTPKDLSKLDTPVLDCPPEFITKEGLKSCSSRLLPKGAILFSSRAPIGLTAIAGREMCTNQGFKSLIPGDEVDSGYLYHCMKWMAPKIAELGNGATFKEVSKEVVGRVEIPLPPLTEQRRIAAILDKANAIRRKRQQAILLTEDFLRSVFLDMFGDPVTNPKGWEVRPLGDICEFTAGNSLPAGEPYSEQEEGHLLLKVGDMNLPGNEIFISTAREWTDSYRGRMTAPKGAIILPKRGGAISTNKKRMLTRPALLDPNLMGIYSPEGQINSYCLFQWFQGFDLNEISSGSAVPQLNKQDLAPLKIALPPKPLQEKFENIVKKVFAIKDLQKSRGYEDLFNALVQRAFRDNL